MVIKLNGVLHSSVANSNCSRVGAGGHQSLLAIRAAYLVQVGKDSCAFLKADFASMFTVRVRLRACHGLRMPCLRAYQEYEVACKFISSRLHP
jgi:hypothetical protein